MSSLSFLMFGSLLFTLLFQNQFMNFPFVLFVSVVLILSSFISILALKIELASDFLFLQAWIALALTDFN